jgi:hypothetical protein
VPSVGAQANIPLLPSSTAFLAHLFSDYFASYRNHPSVTHIDYLDVDESGRSGRPNSIIVCASFAARPAKRSFYPSFLTLHSRVFPPFAAIFQDNS